MARQDSPSDFNYVNELSEPIHGEPVQGVDLENNSSAFQPQDDSLDAPLLPLAVDGINRGHVASTKVATKDKGWAIAFKINVVVTVIAAVCFGKLAIDAVANDSLSRAGRRRLQLHGGYGYTKEFLPERWLRDLRLNTIGGGTSEIMGRIWGREVFGR